MFQQKNYLLLIMSILVLLFVLILLFFQKPLQAIFLSNFEINLNQFTFLFPFFESKSRLHQVFNFFLKKNPQVQILFLPLWRVEIQVYNQNKQYMSPFLNNPITFAILKSLFCCYLTKLKFRSSCTVCQQILVSYYDQMILC